MNDPINPETQYADLRYEPDPARQAERDQLGLLGRIGEADDGLAGFEFS